MSTSKNHHEEISIVEFALSDGKPEFSLVFVFFQSNV